MRREMFIAAAAASAQPWGTSLRSVQRGGGGGAGRGAEGEGGGGVLPL